MRRTCVWTTVVAVFAVILVAATTTCAYSNDFQLRRWIRCSSSDGSSSCDSDSLTVAECGYEQLLKGWREDNLGLPRWLVPPPIVLNQGDQRTGVGFELMRIPPFGLREGIIDCSILRSNNNDNDNDTTTASSSSTWIMTYTILNPGWLTWPVEEYLATVRFSEQEEEDAQQIIQPIRRQQEQQQQQGNKVAAVVTAAQNDIDGGNNDKESGLMIEWTAQWTPLPMCGPLVAFLIRLILQTAMDYVVAGVVESTSKKRQSINQTVVNQ